MGVVSAGGAAAPGELRSGHHSDLGEATLGDGVYVRDGVIPGPRLKFSFDRALVKERAITLP